MPTMTPDARHALHDLCDTLEVIVTGTPGSAAGEDLWDQIEAARLLLQGQSDLSVQGYARAASGVIVNAAAFMESDELSYDAGQGYALRLDYLNHLTSVAKHVAASDLSAWNNIIDRLVSTYDITPPQEHFFRNLPLAAVDAAPDIDRRQALGSLLFELNDCVGKYGFPAPRPNEAFDLRYLTVTHVEPTTAGQPIESLLRYDGQDVMTIQHPVTGAQGDTKPDDLVLAGMARDVFFHGNKDKAIAPMAADSSAVERQISFGVELGGKSISPYTRSYCLGMLAHRLQTLISLQAPTNDTATAPAPGF